MPFEVLEDSMCRRYGCLPSQLDREDAGRLLRNMEAWNLKQTVEAFIAHPESLSESDNALMAELLTLDAEDEDG